MHLLLHASSRPSCILIYHREPLEDSCEPASQLSLARPHITLLPRKPNVPQMLPAQCCLGCCATSPVFLIYVLPIRALTIVLTSEDAFHLRPVVLGRIPRLALCFAGRATFTPVPCPSEFPNLRLERLEEPQSLLRSCYVIPFRFHHRWISL